jgi:hypothetical protein
LTKILCRALPKTKTAHSLIFSSIEIPPRMCEQLANFLDEFIFVTHISFRDLELRDKDFERLFRGISPEHFESVEFNNCNIPQSLYPTVVHFLNKIKKLGSKSKLRTFNVDNRQFDEEQRNKIAALSGQLSKKKRNLVSTSNQPSVQKEYYSESYDSSISPPAKIKSRDITIDLEQQPSQDAHSSDEEAANPQQFASSAKAEQALEVINQNQPNDEQNIIKEESSSIGLTKKEHSISGGKVESSSAKPPTAENKIEEEDFEKLSSSEIKEDQPNDAPTENPPSTRIIDENKVEEAIQKN